MKSVRLLFAAGAFAIGCDGHRVTTSPRLEAPRVSPQPPTFGVYGYVRDENGIPVVGAEASITSSTFTGSSVTNPAGYFAFERLRGQASLRIWLEPYEIYVRDTLLTSNVILDVKLKKAVYGDTLVLGGAIRSFVARGSPPCDPIHWDASAPCRRFLLTPKTNGNLLIAVTWFGLPELDVTITTTGGTYVGTSGESLAGRVVASASLEAGVTYEVRVNSYYDSQVFDIRADLTP